MEISEMMSTAIAAMGPDEPSSPTGEGSPAEAYSKYDDPNYYDPKWGQDPSKVWEPYLQEFTIFPKLPIEIRQAIWKLTVRPRTVEIYHSTTRGYWSNVKVPTALRVNRDSRNAVGYSYPLCFGSVLHEPRIVFNFSMDILYFDDMMWTEIPRFLTSLKDAELTKIQSIAVSMILTRFANGILRVTTNTIIWTASGRRLLPCLLWSSSISSISLTTYGMNMVSQRVREQRSFSNYSLMTFSGFSSMKKSTWMMKMVSQSVRSCPILTTCWKDSMLPRRVHSGDGSLLSLT
ncbi:hypothetical protein L207DRAFT_158225 [Hyaloscypha variabilis F]|jgi:hypothetical protein|uniref:2EXR domain-containing protein n=1 Tax=Hyaloscypha variabilis (strain UAMH 11265 / GT02V1 / F) TaxID=1149755 RepID=A0A2J6S9L8_HYAVF|nr:hypothetical protein L207DRAFT_158225 [Hyaloscypha variabilis F]